MSKKYIQLYLYLPGFIRPSATTLLRMIISSWLVSFNDSKSLDMHTSPVSESAGSTLRFLVFLPLWPLKSSEGQDAYLYR